MPQEFKNCPTLFDEVLSADLLNFQQSYPESVLLPHVDELLIALKTEKARKKATEDLLETLQAFGYRVSANKTQLCTS